MQTIETSKGSFDAEFVSGSAVIQLNVMETPHGCGLFLVYPEGHERQAVDAARSLIERDALEPDSNITADVPGCLVAGTGPLRQFSVEFGVPHVKHAEDA